MADEIANPTPSPMASTDSPSTETTPSSPEVVETTVTETPVVTETVPAVETETPAPEAVKPDTLLGGDKKIEEVATETPVEEKTTETTETPAEPEVAPLPSFEPFTLPEGVTFDETKMGDFTKTLGEFANTTKVDPLEVQKLGQQLVDRHIEELQRYTESLTHAWNKQKLDDWESFQKDPEFANRTNTVGNAAIDAIAVYGGNAKQQQEFRDLMETRGVGNHPAMIRLLSNVMLAKSEPKQLSAPQIATSAKQSKISKMYGTKQ